MQKPKNSDCRSGNLVSLPVNNGEKKNASRRLLQLAGEFVIGIPLSATFLFLGLTLYFFLDGFFSRSHGPTDRLAAVIVSLYCGMASIAIYALTLSLFFIVFCVFSLAKIKFGIWVPRLLLFSTALVLCCGIFVALCFLG